MTLVGIPIADGSPMSSLRFVSSCTSGLVAATIIACSSGEIAQDDRPESAFEGHFEADDPQAAGILEIDLHDTQYHLMADGCADPACEERGTFSVDRRSKRLLLSREDGSVRAVDYEITATEAPAGGADDGITPRALTSGPSQLVTAGVPLVSRVELLGRGFTLLAAGPGAGPCKGTPIEKAVKCVQAKGGKVFSFYRSPANQEAVRRQNKCTDRCTGQAGCVRPTAGCNSSPHTVCKAVDIVNDGAPLSRAELRACGFAKTSAPHANHYDFVN